jgi:hypothetical protein
LIFRVEALPEPHADQGLVGQGPPCGLTLELIDHVDRKAKIHGLGTPHSQWFDALVLCLDGIPIIAVLVPPASLLGW